MIYIKTHYEVDVHFIDSQGDVQNQRQTVKLVEATGGDPGDPRPHAGPSRFFLEFHNADGSPGDPFRIELGDLLSLGAIFESLSRAETT